ncbi:conserved hypothetical lipoprotein [Mycoplasmoides gallisepticum CA06_2006.052-5-2P]|uniref:Conserved hypothetical lipoprotein n=1 Tax=Mycoplasmoides gallisepticum WI01_2001.043-13-2P TaxID=1159201 RepID=J3YHD1_MYCGL|nr:DUF3713 domain-containing protein [Mycoplasmoides gallisepticum]AFP76128.1 conserved hypothetical lipoprotein [Mycoplasmoides gallisepticum VA94_7994-1-7P]AFP76895.1 conserved hypothetical lipoprotein [Mycoplasmoides gallisepticum NC95_13295-2-2P]AFP77653.1 conserved hypothetical lipoprotein [Mycoplasmoides gallisepticum NC96_1596-4-2P]AFP78420.1 conserved hypothetical lipoprotein [Mycoplasmoides gallisepticum NY01_2001.047-5-1P]AFP79180.1 conserved hypothetical lipoprotein [Mycoplasmoides 
MFKNKKHKILAASFLLSGVTVVSMVASSCSSAANNPVVEGLFKIKQHPENFSNSSAGSFNAVLQNSLETDQGFNDFARFLIANSLADWYTNNATNSIVQKYRGWERDAETKLESETTSLRNQFRRNFEIRRQTDLFDPSGGTADSYKRRQVLTNVFTDFSSMVFQNNYLGYFDDKNKKVDNPLIDVISKPENWKNFKFYSDGYTDSKSTQNDNQMFADFQAYVFDQWVKRENPNLVSRIVFTNENINGGLDQIFDKKVLGDELKASYSFQAFTNPNQVIDRTSPKLSTGFRQLVANDGLVNYYNPANFTVDFLNQFSSDSGGKLLMSASDMFNSFDVAFSTAYVQQYQDLTNNVDKDNAIASVTLDPNNIMKNFIFANQANANSAYSTTLDLTSNDPQLKELSEKIKSSILVDKIADNSYYDIYKQYAEGKARLHEYIRPTSSDMNSNEIQKQFILSRGKDGIHIMAIDGANYYLTGSSRNIEKQKEFLLFRNQLVNNPDFSRFFSEKSYQFNVLDPVKKYYDKNNITLTIEFLLNAIDDQNSFLHKPGNEALLGSLTKASSILKDLVKAKVDYDFALKVKNDAINAREKIIERAGTFDNLIKTDKTPAIGIAGKLPHPAAADGSYVGIESYYKNLLVENKLLPENTLTTKDQGLSKLFDQVVNDTKAKYFQTAKTAAEGLLLNGEPSYTYSQNVFVSSRYDPQYSLAANLAINTTIALPTSTNDFKRQFYLNDQGFTNFYDPRTNQFKDFEGLKADQIKNVVNFYFIQSTWESQANKVKYGSWATKAEYNNVLNNYFDNQRTISNLNDDARLNYLRYLNTFRYLIQDNLAEFKRILSTQITRGVSANVSWTLTNGTKLDNNGNIASTQDKINFTNFVANTNYLQGSKFNLANLNKATDNNPNSQANNLNYSTTNNNQTVYGFNGLSIANANNNTNLNTEVRSVLFDNFEQSGQNGVLYAFGGSLEDVVNYVNTLTTNRELDAFVELLRRAQVNINLFDTDANGMALSAEQRRSNLISQLSDTKILPADVYTKFVGYVGQNKVSSTDLTTQPDSFVPFTAAKSLLNWTTYIKQINFKEVANLGGASWLTNPSNRLDLSVDELLSIVAKYAFDNSYQNNAELAIISQQSLIDVNDKRLYDALGLRWVLRNS